MIRFFFFSITAVAQSLVAAEPDWLRFRGPNGSGVSDATGLPVAFGPTQNVLWKAKLPPGHSSPILVGDHVCVTGFSTDRLYTICLDRHSGRELWRQELPRPKPVKYHAKNSPASATPVSDGRHLYVFFQEAGLVSYDLGGKVRWDLHLTFRQTGHGMGASPILAGELVLMNCDLPKAGSFLIAVEKSTGRIRWRTERGETGPIAGFATPVLFGEDEIVVPGSLQWAAYSIRTGVKRWWLGDMPSQPKGSAIVVGDRILGGAPRFAEGAPDEAFSFANVLAADMNQDGRISRDEASSFRPEFDWADENHDGLVTEDEWNARTAALRGRNSLVALAKPSPGDVTPRVLWKSELAVPRVTTPIHYRGVLYLLKEGGVLTSVDPDTGEVLKKGRLQGALDDYFASPVAADGKLYLTSQNGHVVVVKAGAQWEILAVNDMGDECFATPAVVERRLYVRTKTMLYCFENVRANLR